MDPLSSWALLDWRCSIEYFFSLLPRLFLLIALLLFSHFYSWCLPKTRQ